MRRLGDIVEGVVKPLGIEIEPGRASATGEKSAQALPGRPAGSGNAGRPRHRGREEATRCQEETVGEARVGPPSPASSEDELPECYDARLSRTGLTQSASVHAISPAAGQAGGASGPVFEGTGAGTRQTVPAPVGEAANRLECVPPDGCVPCAHHGRKLRMGKVEG